MTRAQILAKRRTAAIKNLGRAVRVEIRRSCGFTTVDECLDQLKIGLDSMEKAGMITNYELCEESGWFTITYQRPNNLGGEWVTLDFELRLTNR